MTEPTLSLTDVSAPAPQAGCGCGCGCGSSDATPPQGNNPAVAPMDGVVSTFQVTGMTCGSCVAAVTRALTTGIPGVSQVTVDLASGQVTVSGDRAMSAAAVDDAVSGAGYELVPGSLR